MRGFVEIVELPGKRHRYVWRLRRPSGSVAGVSSQEFKLVRDALDDCKWLNEQHGFDIYQMQGTIKEKLT